MPSIQTILRCMPKRLEDRMLPLLPYTPVTLPPDVVLPIKHPRHDIDMQGPERIHNQLIYQQFGIIALGGGALRGAHYDVIRDAVNKWIDFERFFAVWRIDPPWKPVSKRSQGKKAGGGKAKVHHYEFPVKAGRIILEIGGVGQYEEVERVLTRISKRMPMYNMPVTQAKMDELKKEKLELDAKNYNPFDYRTLVRKNFSDSQRLLAPTEALWGGTYL